MNNLHRDILEESAFRDQLLATTLATNRRARRNRTLARTAAVSAAFVVSSLIFFPRHRDPVTANPSAPSASSAVNQTAPPTYALIHTTPLPRENLLTVSSRIEILDTASHPAITPITDDQLLALFAGHPVALIAGPRGEELILLETLSN